VTDDVTLSPMEQAQARLAKACMGMQMNPQGAAISGFLNSMLISARIDALAELVLGECPNASWTKPEWFEHLTTKHMNSKAEQMEAQMQEAPRLVAANGNALRRQ